MEVIENIKVFTSQVFLKALDKEEVKVIIKRFKEYKSGIKVHDSFGRDVDFNRPPSARMAELKHLHINESQLWGKRQVPSFKLLQFNRVSDTHLVYCSGFTNKNYFLLMSFIASGALYNDTLYMIELSEMAERFRSRY